MLISLSIVVLITYFFWVPFYRNPLYQDQSLHYYIGKSWLKGKIPYRDYAMAPGPLLGLIYAFFSLFPKNNDFIINFLTAGLIAVGNIFIFLTADLLYDSQAALLASIFFALYIFNPRLIGDRFPPESYSIPFCIAALYFLFKGMREPFLIYPVLCGFSIGSATLIRQSTLIYVPIIFFSTLLDGHFSHSILFSLSFVGIHLFWIIYFFRKRALRQYIVSTIWNAVMVILFANPLGSGRKRVDRMRLKGERMVSLIVNNSITIFPLYLISLSFIIYAVINRVAFYETLILSLFFIAGLLLIFPRKNFDTCYWLNSMPWAAILSGNHISLLLLYNNPFDIYNFTTISLLLGLIIFVIGIDYRLYFTLDPEKRNRFFDPMKISHASFWTTFDKIGEFIQNNTKKNHKIQVFGHAARVYNRADREAFFYSPCFVPFKHKDAGLPTYDRFLSEIKTDYPEIIILAGHMPAFPHNPKPYLEDLEVVKKESGIFYIPRKFIDDFPIFFADTEKSYISAIIKENFLNERLKTEKERISKLTLDLEKYYKVSSKKQALLYFMKRLKETERYEDIIHTFEEIENRNSFSFSRTESEFLMLSLGEAQYGTGQKELAEKTFLRIIELKPDSCEAFNNLGVIYFEDRNYNQAINMFKNALVHDPQNPTAIENMGIILNLPRVAQKEAILIS